MTQTTSIYLHIPFCTHRCAYCDFNTYAGQEGSIPAYVEALCREIKIAGGTSPEVIPVHTIFFGGGTPSLLSPAQLGKILTALRQSFKVQPGAEISMEANPGTVSLGDLCALREMGINRLSFGVQSANTEELHMLERIHDFFQVIDAVAWARKAGFENLNLDVIYGLPEQKLETWQQTVHHVIDLKPDHISAYALSLEHGTPFGRWSKRGLIATADPDLAADMYEWVAEELASKKYMQYEISNWGAPLKQCQHNLQYWRGLPYLAFGAGAHGYANGYRYSNVLRIKTYIDRLMNPGPARLPFPLTSAVVNQHLQTPSEVRSEYMMTGLRLTLEGISRQDFEARFGTPIDECYGPRIAKLQETGLLEWADGHLRLTRRGRLLGNRVFLEFLD